MCACFFIRSFGILDGSLVPVFAAQAYVGQSSCRCHRQVAGIGE
jgi:hypothetical protein